MRYSNSSKDKANGVVYTPYEMAEYLAKEILKRWNSKGISEIAILDPAVGEGELLVAMLQAISFDGMKISVVGYETDKSVGTATFRRLKELFPSVQIDIRAENFLDAVDTGTTGKYDLVIANPPYIRTQILGSDRAQRIAQKLSLEGRVDIYYAFILYVKNVLKPNGVAGYITSNKFLTIKAGASVRNFMLQNYQIHCITDLGDTKLFNASVLPCIIVFTHGQTTDRNKVEFTSVYQEESATRIDGIASNIFEPIHDSGVYQITGGRCYRYQQGTISSVQRDSLWTISSNMQEEWLRTVEAKTWFTFSQIGEIRVGIKTTADNVFIGDQWIGEKAELELLRPLITHRNAGQIVAKKCPEWKVLYTHTTINGKKVPYDLDQYPKSKAYLLSHFKQLNDREYVKKANRNWFEIWVPQNPIAWKHRKIVFRDISAQPQFWLDNTGAIVNGDCYWIDIFPEVSEDIVYLALAVANSQFIEKYYDVKFNTKLYSGKRRYQTQYVKQFPIPYYGSELAQETIAIVKAIIAEGNSHIADNYKEKLDVLVDRLFS